METTLFNYNTVNDFRTYLEVSYQTKYDSYSFFSKITSENESVLKEMGFNRFLLNDHFDSIWSSANLEESTRINLIEYCTFRLSETQNPHLLERYNYALLVITKNNLYAYGAIDAYWNILGFYLKASKNNNESVFEFLGSTKEILRLYISYKKDKIEDIANYLNNILYQDYPLNLKIGILRIFSKEKIFKSTNIQQLLNICIEIYNKTKNKNCQEAALEIGLKLTHRIQNNIDINKFAELLGDLTLQNIQDYDDKNIAVSHMNELTYEKAIAFYKLAKNEEKISTTTIKLEENRTHHRYLKFPIYSKSDNIGVYIDCVNKLVAEDVKKNLLEIIFPLCKNNNSSLLIGFDKLRASLTKNNPDNLYTSCFEAVRVDKWGNKHTTTHDAVAMHDSFHLMYQRSTLLYVPLLLCNCMNVKKIGNRQFRTALKKAVFFIPISIKRSGGYVDIPLYEIVGKGLEDYIKQNNKSFIGRSKADWRFCVDFLTPKFEFVIRCIASILGIPVVKTNKDGEMQFVTLEKILAEPKLKDVFNEDDIFLFSHTFTKDGLNIRNEVAHGLLLPQDYTSEIALLVFLSVLRLSKIVDYVISQKQCDT